MTVNKYITAKNYHHNLLCPFSSRTGGKPILIRSKPCVHLRRIYYIYLYIANISMLFIHDSDINLPVSSVPVFRDN